MNEIDFLESLIEINRFINNANNFINGKYAASFNYIKLLELGRNENRLSRIIAFLLNNRSDHGQKHLLLKELITILKLDSIIIDNKTSYSVRTEYGITNQRRIDIYIEGVDWIIAIENKVDAYDQNNQVIDYLKFLRAKNKRVLLIYLSPSGDSPSENSISMEALKSAIDKQELLITSYKTLIIPWLERIFKETECEKIIGFVKELIEYLASELYGEEHKMGDDKLIDFILKDNDSLAAFFSSFQKMNAVKEKLIFEFIDNMIKKAKELQYGYNNYLSGNIIKDSSFEFTKEAWQGKSVHFRFSAKPNVGITAFHNGITKCIGENPIWENFDQIDWNLLGQNYNWSYDYYPWALINNKEIYQLIEDKLTEYDRILTTLEVQLIRTGT